MPHSRNQFLFKGYLLQGSNTYEEARKVFNSSIIRVPKAIIQPTNFSEVVSAVLNAKQHQCQITVRNGGHSATGSCLQNECLLIDMRKINHTHLDLENKRITIGGGALLRDLLKAASPYHLGTPTGDCPMVGIAGLTLGGGNGFLSKQYGLTCDNLFSATLVTANGDIVKTSKSQHADLFWGLQGAGHGNFGVVTELELQLHPLPPLVFGGRITWPVEQAEEILKQYNDLMHHSSDDLNIYCRINQYEKQQPVIYLYGMYNGAVEEGKSLFEGMTQWGKPLEIDLNATNYGEMQLINEDLIQENPGFLWKNGLLESDLNNDIIQVLLVCYQNRPNIHARINLDTLGGAINRVPNNATSFWHRSSRFIISVLGVWNTPAEEAKSRLWAQQSIEKLSPFLSGYTYPNYDDIDLKDSQKASFGGNLKRIRTIKQKYDPEGLFRGSLNFMEKN